MAADTASTGRRLYRRIRSRIGRARRDHYYRDPAAYWEKRHQHFRQHLDGVGTKGLGEAGNREDYQVKWDHLDAALHALGVTPGPVLDAGCGIGWFSERLASGGYQPVAVDFSPAAVEIARQRLGQDAVQVGSLDGFRAGRTFPLVICIDVLFHLVNDGTWRAAVANLAAHVDPGGYLVVQDHLVGVPDQVTDPTARHTRWRSLDIYQGELPTWDLVHHDQYLLPSEGRTKDLVVFARR